MAWYRLAHHLGRIILAASLVIGGPTTALASLQPGTSSAGSGGPAMQYALPISAAGTVTSRPTKSKVQMDVLASLLSTAQGRALLQHGVGLKKLLELEHLYGGGNPLHASAPPSSQVTHITATRLAPPPAYFVLNPGRAPAGAQVPILGANFGANEPIDFLIDGVYVTTITAGSAGNIPPTAYLTIPANLAAGNHTAVAVGRSSGVRASFPLAVYGLIVLPAQAQPGDAISVAGAGFSPGQVVTLTLGMTSAMPQMLGIGGTDGAGTLSPITLTLPLTTAVDLQGITAQDHYGEQTTVPFAVVTTTLGITPAAVSAGASVTLTGDGFGSYEAVGVSIDGALVAHLGADQQGRLTAAAGDLVTIPATLAPGTHRILVLGLTSGHSLTGSVRLASLTVQPASGPAGSIVTVSGAGFAAGEVVTVTLGSSTGSTTANGNGLLAPLRLVSSAIAPLGTLPISAQGAAGDSVTAAFQVVGTTLGLAPTSGPPGTLVSVQGDGFASGESVSLYDQQSSVALDVTSASAGGTISTTYSVPAGVAPGVHTIQAVGAQDGHILSALFTEAALVSGASMTLTPPSSGIGQAITIQLNGFASSSAATIYVGGDQNTGLAVAGPLPINGAGAISTSVALPALNQGGNLLVTAYDPASAQVATASLLITPSVQVSVASAVPGALITVTGGGFLPNEPVDLLLDGTPITGSQTTSYPLGHGMSDAQGALTAPLTFTVPALVHGAAPVVGDHMIYVYGRNSQRLASVALNVLPSALGFVPDGGASGSSFAAYSAGGFVSQEPVLFYWDGDNTTGTYIGQATANLDGSVVAGLSTPQSAPVGLHTVTAVGLWSHTAIAGVFSVVALAPSVGVGPVGGSVTLTATGYAPGEQVDLTLALDSAHSQPIDSALADAQGTAIFTDVVPASIQGIALSTGAPSAAFVATGRDNGFVAHAPFHVLATALVVSPASGDAPTQVAVSVSSGFAPHEIVLMYWNGDSHTGQYIGQAVADGLGALHSLVSLPADQTGAHILSAVGVHSGTLLQATYTVARVLLSPSVGVADAVGSVGSGTPVTVTLAGFSPNEQVTLLWDSSAGSSPVVATGLAAGDGSAVLNMTVPSYLNGPVVPGVHTVYAVGQQSGTVVSAAFVVQQSALSLVPEQGLAGATTRVAGAGMAAGELVHLYWIAANGQFDPNQRGTYLGGVFAGSDGAFATAVTVPSGMSGPDAIVAYGEQSGRTEQNTFDLLATTLSLSASPLSAGGSVAITGTGFISGENVLLTWDGDGTTTPGTPIGPLSGITATMTGAIGPQLVTIPTTAGPGQHQITALGGTSGTLAGALVIIPGIAAFPAQAQAGDTISLSGAGFAASESVAVLLDASSLVTLTADARGVIAALAVALPPTLGGGTHTVQAIGTQSGASYSTALTVIGLALSPSETTPGSSIHVTGAGFGGGDVVTLYLGDQSGMLPSDQIGSATATSTGLLFASATFASSLTAGLYSIYAVDATTHVIEHASITLYAGQLAVQPSAGEAGDTITVAGTGFAASETAHLYLDGLAVGSMAASGLAGGERGTFVIPATIAAGTSHVLQAVGQQSGHSVAGVLRVFNVTAVPSEGIAGASVRIQGAGFGSSEIVTAALGLGTLAVNGLTTASAQGVVSASLTVPIGTPLGAQAVSLRGAAGEQAFGHILVITPTLSVSPASAQAGDSVTVQGDGFAANEQVSLSLSGGTWTTVNAGADGHLTQTAILPFGYAAGPYTISAFGQQSQHSIAGGFNLLSLSGSLSVAAPGTRILMSGAGFGAGENVQLYWDGDAASGILLGSAVASVQGSFSGVAIVVPRLAVPGDYPLYAYGMTGHGVASTVVVVANQVQPVGGGPGVTVTPPGASAGTTLFLTGSGPLTANEPFNVYLDGDSRTGIGPIGSGQANAQGAFAASALLPPTVSVGGHKVYVVGLSSGATYTGDFRVVGVSINPTAASIGSSVSVTGTGFSSVETVTVALDSAYVLTGTAASGTLSGSFVVPSGLAPGQHTVRLIGLSTRSVATIPLVISSAALTTAPVGAQSGSVLTATAGAGNYQPGEPVYFYWDGGSASGTYLGQTTAAADGSASAQLTVPMAQTGTHTVVAYGQASATQLQTSFSVTSLQLGHVFGTAGTVVDLTGGGFTAGDIVQVLFGMQATPVVSTTTTDGSLSPLGGFSYVTPVAAPGVYTITATDLTSGVQASAPFHYLGLTATAAGVPAGGSLRITGRGFVAGEDVSLYLDGNQTSGRYVAAALVDGSSAFTASVRMPSTIAGGSHVITALGTQSQAAITVPVSIVTAALSPHSALPGATVGISGSAFVPGEALSVYFNGDNQTGLLVASGHADASGSVSPSSLTFIVPTTLLGQPITPGSYAVALFGTTGQELVSMTLSVGTANLTLTPARGQTQSIVQVQGSGFQPNEQVYLALGLAQSSATFMGLASASAAGVLSTTVTVPVGVEPVAQTVFAQGVTSGQVITAAYQVVGMALHPAEAVVGTGITIDGGGFAASEGVSFTLDALTGTLLATTTADAQGGFVELPLTVPLSTGLGQHIIVADGVTSHSVSTATLLVDALPTATPLPSPTATATPAPPVPTVGGITGGGSGCFSISVGGWTLSATSCPSSTVASNVVITAPSGLHLSAPIPPLSSLALVNNLPSFPLSLPNFSFSRFNATLSASGVMLDTTGVTIGQLTLTLPAALGGSAATAANVHIGIDGSLSGTITFNPQTLSFSAGGFSASLSGVQITTGSLSATSISVALPGAFATSSLASLTGSNVTISLDPSGGVGIGLTDATLNLASIPVALHGITFTGHSISVTSATVSVPNPAGSGHLTLTGSNLVLNADGTFDGSLSAPGLSTTLGGFSAQTGALVLDRAGLHPNGLALTLPAAFGGGTLTGSNVLFGSDGSISGTVALTPQTLNFAIDGFVFSASNLTLSHTPGGPTTLAVAQLSLTIPAALVPAGVGQTITATNVSLNADGTFGGSVTLPDLDVTPLGFAIHLQGVTLGRTGLSVANASYTLPAILTPPGGASIVLSGTNLTIHFDGTLTGSLATPANQINLYGFDVQTGVITLDSGGLHLASLTLSLPRSIGGVSGLAATDVSISAHGQVSGTVALTPQTLVFSYGGFAITASNVGLSPAGISVGTLQVTVPPSLLPSGSSRNVLTSSNALMTGHKNADGSVNLSLTMDDTVLQIAGFAVDLQGLTLSQRLALSTSSPISSTTPTTPTFLTTINVMTATTVLPTGSVPGVTTPITLTGYNLGIDSRGHVIGQLAVAGITLRIAGYPIQTGDITLDSSGLYFASVSLALPKAFGSTTLTAQNVAIGRGGTISGTVALSGTTSFTYAGFSLSATDLALSGSGALTTTHPLKDLSLTVGALSLTLPRTLVPSSVSNTITAHNVIINSDGTVGGSVSLGALQQQRPGLAALRHVTTLAGHLAARGVAHLLAGSRTTHAPASLLGGTLNFPPFHLNYAGFSILARGISLTTKSLVIGDAELALPANLVPTTTSPITLTGALTVTARPASISGSIAILGINLALAGFSLAVDSVTLDSTGLNVNNAQLALPSQFSLPGAAPITITGNLSISPKFAIVGSLQIAPFDLSYGGFSVHADSITLDNSGLSVINATAQVPTQLGGSTITGQLNISPHFVISGSLSIANTSFSYHGLNVSVDSISLDSTGTFKIVNAQVSVPNLTTATLVGNLTASYDSHKKFQIYGQLAVNNVQLAYGGFVLNVPTITLDTNGILQIPNATLSLPSLTSTTLTGNLTATFSGGKPTISGTLQANNINVSYGGFSLSVPQITLDTSGVLQIPNVSLTLPGVLNTPITGNLTAGLDSHHHLQVYGQLMIQNVNLSFSGFTLAVATITLSTSGLAADGVSLTLPSSLDVNGQPLTLTGALSITRVNGKTVIDGHIDLPSASLAFAGFDLSVTAVTLGTQGLTIGNATLSLPSIITALPGSPTSFSVIGLSISPKGDVTGGTIVDNGGNNLTFTLFGATLTGTGVTISNQGLSVQSVAVTLPSELGGAGPFNLGGFTMRGDNTVSGTSTSSSIGFSLADIHASASGFSFTGGGISIASVSISLPIFQGKLTLNGLTFDGHNLNLTGGSGSIALPPINVGGFVISASASLTLSITNGVVNYDFIGSGTVGMAGVGQLSATIEIGTIGNNHPSNLYYAELNLQITGAGIPIPETPLEITGLDGAIHITGTQGNPVFTFKVALDLQTDDEGVTFHGTGGAVIASDGNFGLFAHGTVLDILNVGGGFCLRFVAAHDYVCSTALIDASGNTSAYGQKVELSSSTGFYLVVSASFALPLPVGCTADIASSNPCAGIYGNAHAHIWIDNSGPEIAAEASVQAILPANTFGTLLPPCQLSAGVDIQAGKFTDPNNNTVQGFLASVDLNICSAFTLSGAIFLDTSGNFSFYTSAPSYTLIDTANNVAYLLTQMPNGLAHIERVPGLASSLYPSQTSTAIVVAPGQTDTMFALGWRAGAPSLSLIAPDGSIYTPAAPGSGHVFQTTDASRLPNGLKQATALYFSHPMAGTWRVLIGNLRGNEGYRLNVTGSATPPTLTVSVPSTGQTLVADPLAHLTGTLTGTDASASSTLSLYYTTIPTTTVRGGVVPNYVGTLISNSVPVTNGAWAYTWDTSTLPAGPYYVYATLNSGVRQLVQSYAPGMVLVRQPTRPDAPRDVVAVDHNGQLSVMWAPPARAGTVAGYVLQWRTAAPKAAPGPWYPENLGNLQSFTLNEAQKGVTYQVAVADYNQRGVQSAASTAQVLVASPHHPLRAQASDFRVSAPSVSTVAGGYLTIPLLVHPTGSPTHGPGDFVDLSVAGLPPNIAVQPSVNTVNIFAQPLGPARPVLNVLVRKTVPPGRYRLLVIARQAISGRTRTSVVTLIVRTGAPDFVTMLAGRPVTRPDGLLSVPIVARVVDAAGAPVSNGSSVAFSSVDGAAQPSVVTTVGGLAQTHLIYVPGTLPIVSADAVTAVGHLSLGPAPSGASTSRYFAASAGQVARTATVGAAAVRPMGEDLIISNPFATQAQVRAHLFIGEPHNGTTTEQVVTIPVNAHSTVTEHLDTLRSGYAPLIGIDVRSDLPVVSRRVLRYTLPSGKAQRVGSDTGTTSGRAQATFRLASDRAMLDLFNPSIKPVQVVITASRTGVRGVVTTRLMLAPLGVACVVASASASRCTNVSAAEATHLGAGRGYITLSMQANQPIIANLALEQSLPTLPVYRPAGQGKRVNGLPGVSVDRFFAAAAGQAGVPAGPRRPAVPAISEQLVLKNPLATPARVQMHFALTDPVHHTLVLKAIAVVIPPHRQITQQLSQLRRGGSPLIGIEVRSSSPIISQHQALQVVGRGETRLIATDPGTDSPRSKTRVQFASAQSALVLYNPSSGTRQIEVTVSRAHARGQSTMQVNLSANGSTCLAIIPSASPCLNLSGVIAAHVGRGAGAISVALRSAGAFVVSAALEKVLPPTVRKPVVVHKVVGHAPSRGHVPVIKKPVRK